MATRSWSLFLALALAGTSHADDPDPSALRYVAAAAEALAGGPTVVDARPVAACTKRTIRQARCLPAADFMGPHHRLASFRDITWVLGTAGLSGSERVLVVGEEPLARDFVAGLLYLAGQARVSVLTEPLSTGAGVPAGSFGPGRRRGPFREPIFRARMRDQDIVLRDELVQLQHPPGGRLLLDGRSEAEYWGLKVRTVRGGHLPGAWSMPQSVLRAQLDRGALQLPDGLPLVVYGHDAYESVAMLTLVVAGAGRAASVYLDGWADWAAHDALPADSVTYPDRQAGAAPRPSAAPEPDSPGRSGWSLLGGVLIGMVLALVGIWILRRRRSTDESAV